MATSTCIRSDQLAGVLRRIARLVLTQQLALGGIAFGDMDYLALHRIECPDIADGRGDDALQMENSRSRAVRSTCRNFVTILLP